MNKARETRERHTDKFHNSMSSLGFEPPNHGVAAIVANHWPRIFIIFASHTETWCKLHTSIDNNKQRTINRERTIVQKGQTHRYLYIAIMQHQSIRYSSLRAVLLKRDGFLSQSNATQAASILDDEIDIVKWFLIAMDIECLKESFTEYNDS